MALAGRTRAFSKQQAAGALGDNKSKIAIINWIVFLCITQF